MRENLSLHYNHCFLKPSSLREHSNCVWYIKKKGTRLDDDKNFVVIKLNGTSRTLPFKIRELKG